METIGREVRTEFTARDAGVGATVMRMASAFEGGAKRLDHLRERVGEFRREQGLTTLAALGLGYGVGSWIEKIKEANTEFAQTQKGIAGVLTSALDFGKGTSEIDQFTRSMKIAKGVTEELEESAGKYVMPLDDVTAAYKKLLVATGGLGLSQEKVMGLTEASIATAKRYGVSGEEAAQTIARALTTKAIRPGNDFSLAMRMTLGDLHKLSAPQIYERIQKGLKGSKDIAEAMGGGIGGALTRAQITVSALLRDATGPLFKEIAKSLEGWSKHISQVGKDGKSLVESFAGKLVAGFHTLQSISGFIREHWVAIGAVFAGLKVGELAASLGGGLAGLGAGVGRIGALGGVGSALSGAGGLLGTLGAVAPMFGAIVTAGGLAAIALKGVYDEWQSRKKQASELGDFFSTVGEIAKTQAYMQKHNSELTNEQIEAGKKDMAVRASAAAEILKQKGLFENGAIAMEKFNGIVDSMASADRDKFAAMFKSSGLGAGASAGLLGAAAAEVLSRNLAVVRQAARTEGVPGTKPPKPVYNFNGGIHVTWKNEEKDPGRAFLRFWDNLENQVHARSQAMTAEPLGD